MGVCLRRACVDNTILEKTAENTEYKVGSEGAFPPRKISLVISTISRSVVKLYKTIRDAKKLYVT